MGMHRVLLRLTIVALCFMVLAAAFGLSILLASVGGVFALGTLALAVGYGVFLAQAATRLSARLEGPFFVFASIVTGSLAGSIAIAIGLASLSSDWRLHARALPHASWSLLAFVAVALALLPTGIRGLQGLIRERRLFRRHLSSSRAPIHPRDEAHEDVYRIS